MARTGGHSGADRLLSELVSSPQRREVVWYLTDNGGSAGFEDIVDVIASDADRTMTAVRLHHVHLPKLRTAGAIEWDDERGEVRLTPRAHAAVDDVARSGLLGQCAGD
ncbi:DUF7344 domain-containing protein [Salinigranum halophilum]|jgi:hypothetical protein|uniref:DUF7344 domain-containing protein n=1 Tax=Salinigranum halophilum TaxID=2565931 RepID=UPI0010A7937D|nr:hypothetical protein [Salinigranum halophilum]